MRSKENIEHEVTNCTFCDCKVKWSVSLAEFLSYLENITGEKTEHVKRIDIDRTDPWKMGQNVYKIWAPIHGKKIPHTCSNTHI